MRRIAALVPYVPGSVGGQRVRIEAWAGHLERAGWTVDLYPFEDRALHDILFRPGRPLLKARRMFTCYVRQLARVMRGPPCDILFIYKEAALIGPALLERLATRLGVPIIYDVDDAAFLPYKSPMNGWLSLLKFSRKTHSIFRLSDRVVTINSLLADYAASYNRSVSVVPNWVDTDLYQPGSKPSDGVVRLVWIGSHSNMQNLSALAEPLRRLQARHRVPLHVIGAGEVDLPGVEVKFVKWSSTTEISNLQACDIGLVPLADLSWNPWYRWKSPFKALQYMAVGIPVIARRIGAASEIVEDGVNGFLVETQEEWDHRLEALVTSEDLRRRMGQAARATVLERFSAQVQTPRMLSVFEETLQAR
jgi:glycosyltransferase involved in cell wall biosynthesis